MTIIENKQYEWASKNALIEMIVLDLLHVSDKVGVAKWLKELPNKTVSEMVDVITSLDTDEEKKQLLEEIYNSQLTSAIVVNEKAFQIARNQILTEAENPEKPAPDISKVLKQGGAASAAMYLLYVAANKGHLEARRQLQSLKVAGLNAYQSVVNGLMALSKLSKYTKIVGHILPDMSNYTNANIDYDTKLRQLVNNFKGDNLSAEELEAAINPSKQKITSAKHQDLSNLKTKITNFGKKSRTTAVWLLGITGTLVLLYNIYQRFAGAAAKACNSQKTSKDKTICMLRFKIRACEEAIKAGQEALTGCSKHDNPEKCTHAIQTSIWNMNRRKKKFEMQLSKLVSGHTPTNDSGSKPDIFRRQY